MERDGRGIGHVLIEGAVPKVFKRG